MDIRGERALLAITAFLVCASCGSTAPSRPLPPPPPTVKLVSNPWDASRLDVAIASALLTSEMGMNVEVTEISEYAQFPLLAAGTQHASLEVWPSGHAADIQKYVDTGEVEDIGLLGPTGKISWYLPAYLLTTNGSLDAWQSYQDTATAALFATPKTGGKGQFTSGNPTWTSYDADIIANLGLDLEVVYLGSEQAELDALAAAYANRQPILLYLWSPHPALAKYDLTPVALPPYSAACYAKAGDGGVSCDYPPDPLFKIVWPPLKTSNPRAYAFLKRISFTTDDQSALLNLVDSEGYTVAQAAAKWVAENKRTWTAWIPPK